jgi:hypothetical protein
MKKEEHFEEGKEKKSTLKKIWDIFFWTAFIIIFVIWVTDFVRVTKEEKPIFCFKTNEYTYDDGTTEECVGLGYKVYSYNRSSLSIKKQFTPFFIQMKE